MNLKILDNDFVVCRFAAKSLIPDWVNQSSFFSISRSPSELSIVCESALVPSDIKTEAGWKILKVEGVLDFGLTGILASIANPLAEAKISIFAISTFDTDYILVKKVCLDRACEVLISRGFEIT